MEATNLCSLKFAGFFKLKLTIAGTLGCFLAGALSGCAGLKPEVRFNVMLPGKVDLKHIRRMAVLDFAVLPEKTEHGQDLARALTKAFQDKARFEMVAPEISREALQALRVPRSRFREFAIVRQLGEAIGAEVLLYGDILEAGIASRTETENLVRPNGYREEKSRIIDSQGNTKVVTRLMPVYREVVQKTLIRILDLQAEARLVSVADGAILWQDRLVLQEVAETVYEDGKYIRGLRDNDKMLFERALQKMSEKITGDLLPSVVVRQRILATVSAESEYAALLRKGNEAALKHDWEAAGAWWLKTLVVAEDKPEARANLGILREAAGELSEALKDYEYAARKMGSPWQRYLQEVQNSLQRE